MSLKGEPYLCQSVREICKVMYWVILGRSIMDMAWMIAGGAALTGLVATCWGYIRGFYSYVTSWMVISITVQGYQSDAVQLLLRERFVASKFGPRLYSAWLLHVRPTRRTQLVTMEVIGKSGRLFWSGRKPLWVAQTGSGDESLDDMGVTSRDYSANSLVLTFLRGTFQADDLVHQATEHFNQKMVGFDHDGNPSNTAQRRHFVRHVFGSAGKSSFSTRMSNPGNQGPTTAGDTRACLHHRPVGWTFDQLGSEPVGQNSPIDQLALEPETLQLVEESRFWKTHQQWYRARNIPWRRGVLLHGPPGTGKTALIRAIAEDLDMPVFIYDLASLMNNELQEAWSKMLSQTPCMAVIEDIDAVFHGRENMAAKDNNGLTFDCLLNCLDGIQRADGLFVAVTTNHVDRIDPALGVPENGVSSRPGRIDHTLHLGPLGESARILIASRILRERIDLQEKIVYLGDGDTAAQFQERCAQEALSLLWDNRGSGGKSLRNERANQMGFVVESVEGACDQPVVSV